MAIRMRDVAQLAGVSEATVSLALSGSPRISSATRDRVVALADQLGYRPHAAGRALRTDSTKALGLVVSDVANPFFADLAGQIERFAAAEGYSTMLCNSDEDPHRQDGYLSGMLAGSQVDGLLLVPVDDMTPGIRAAGVAGARIVLLDRPIVVHGKDTWARRLRKAPVVRAFADDALAEVAQLLVALGHRHFGIIALPLHTEIGRQRRDLLMNALRERGIDQADIAVVSGDFRQRSGEWAVEQLLAAPRRPTAFIASDGLMAVGAMKALRRAGLRIPTDVSLVGYDDAPWFDLLDPPLTTVAQPVTELAVAAVSAMLAMVTGQPSHGATPACQLVRRGSCAAPPPQ